MMRHVLLVALLLAGTQAFAGTFGSPYFADGRCGRFPRVDVKTLPGQCVGLVAGPEHGLQWPRSIVQTGPDQLWVSDVVGWYARGQGRVSRLTIAANGTARLERLITGRNLPHGLAIGPDKKVYVGDDDAIWRFDPAAPEPQRTLERILGGLPGKPSRGGDHQHPLKHLAFDRNGDLLINMGSPNDSCEAAPGGRAHPYPCPYVEGDKPDAAIWRLDLIWPGGKPASFKPLARGLRNSIALAVHPRSGLIVQGENSIDKLGRRTDPDGPPDELNVVREGLSYGWPYCVGMGTLIPEYRTSGASCRGSEPPAVLLPAHSAPMGLIYHSGRMLPQLANKLLVAFHGFARHGHRIVAYDVDGDGRPLPPPGGAARPVMPMIVVDDWEHRRGVRPTGRPMALLEGADGAVWFIDDKAATVMVLQRDGGTAPPAQQRQPEPGVAGTRDRPAAATATVADAAPPNGWVPLYHTVLRPRCQGCHEAFAKENAGAAWSRLVEEGLIDPDNIAGSPAVRAMLGRGPGRAMPLPAGLKAFPEDFARLNAFLASLRRR